MNRTAALVLAAIVIAAYLLPFSAREVGTLVPVQTLLLEKRSGQVCLSAGEDLTGRGRTVAQAVEDLRAQAAGEVWLEQTRYVLVSPGAESLLWELKQAAGLRLACLVYRYAPTAGGFPEELTPRLEAAARREPGRRLGQVLNARALGQSLSLPEAAGGTKHGQ